MLDNNTLGARIKAAIESSPDQNQASIAQAFGVTEQAVSGWIRTGKIDKRKLVRLAQLTGRPLDYFLPAASITFVIGEKMQEYFDPPPSQPAGFDDETMAQALELLYLLADARPDDGRFQRLTWPMIQIAAKAVKRAEGASRRALAEILSEVDEG